MVSVNFTLFIEIILVVLSIFILNKLFYQPFLAVIDKRKQKLEKDKQTVTQAKKQLQTLRSFVRKKDMDITEQTRNIVFEAIAVSEKEGREMTSKVAAENDARLSEFRREIEREVEQSKVVLQPEIKAISQSILRKIIPLFIAVFLLSCPVFAVEAGHHSAESEQHEGGISETARTVNFAIMVVILFFLAKKPLATAMENRVTQIRHAFESTAESIQKLEQDISLAEKEKEQLKTKGKQLLEKAQKEALQIRTENQKKNQKAVQDLQENAVKIQEITLEKANHEIRSFLVSEAVAQAEKQLQKGIDYEMDKRLIRDVLSQLNPDSFSLKGSPHA